MEKSGKFLYFYLLRVDIDIFYVLPSKVWEVVSSPPCRRIANTDLLWFTCVVVPNGPGRASKGTSSPGWSRSHLSFLVRPLSQLRAASGTLSISCMWSEKGRSLVQIPLDGVVVRPFLPYVSSWYIYTGFPHKIKFRVTVIIILGISFCILYHIIISFTFSLDTFNLCPFMPIISEQCGWSLLMPVRILIWRRPSVFFKAKRGKRTSYGSTRSGAVIDCCRSEWHNFCGSGDGSVSI